MTEWLFVQSETHKELMMGLSVLALSQPFKLRFVYDHSIDLYECQNKESFIRDCRRRIFLDKNSREDSDLREDCMKVYRSTSYMYEA